MKLIKFLIKIKSIKRFIDIANNIINEEYKEIIRGVYGYHPDDDVEANSMPLKNLYHHNRQPLK